VVVAVIMYSKINRNPNYFSEHYLNVVNSWQTTKSAHMLMSMKGIAILFDYQSNELDTFPSIFEYTGYMLCAGNVIFGPFLTFQEYRNAFLFPVKWVKY